MAFLVSGLRTRTVRATIVLRRNSENSTLEANHQQWNESNRNDDEVELDLASTLSNELIDDPMHTKTLEDDFTNHGNDSDVMVIISKSKIRDFISENVDHIYVKRT